MKETIEQELEELKTMLIQLTENPTWIKSDVVLKAEQRIWDLVGKLHEDRNKNNFY